MAKAARRLLRLAFVVLAQLGSAALPAAAADGDVAVDFETSPFASFAIGDRERVRFGALEWIGGFEIESRNRALGGLSGLLVADGGATLSALSDDALMLRARILRDGDGRPLGLADGVIRPLRRVDGVVFNDRGGAFADSESIDLLPGTRPQQAAIGFEGFPRVFVGPVGADGFVGPLAPVALPAETARLRQTKGFESLAGLPPGSGLDGRMILLAERAEYRAATVDQPGWVIGGRRPIMFRVHRTDDYDLTDAKIGPDGRLYVLERLYSLGAGVWARIRRFDLATIGEGAVIDGETLFEASLADQIDNMEGLALWRDAAGATRISLISDNNRSILQRTVYLEFRLGG